MSACIAYGQAAWNGNTILLNTGNASWFSPTNASYYDDTQSLTADCYGDVEYVANYYQSSGITPSDLSFNVITENNKIYVSTVEQTIKQGTHFIVGAYFYERKMTMKINSITLSDLRRMNGTEGLILQGCGGEIKEWMDGINKMLTDKEILLDNTKFENVSVFQNDGVTCILYPFEDVHLDIGKLAMWRLQSYTAFAGTWLSDYVENKLGGFITDEQIKAEKVKPDCALIGQDGNIFNLLGIASHTLKQNGMADEAKEMCSRVTSSESYCEALNNYRRICKYYGWQ